MQFTSDADKQALVQADDVFAATGVEEMFNAGSVTLQSEVVSLGGRPLTERGLRHMAKVAGIPARLFVELSQETLQKVLSERLATTKLRLFVDPASSAISAVQPAEIPYRKLNMFLSPLQNEDVLVFKGDMSQNDTLSFFHDVGKLPGVQDDIRLGTRTLIYPFGGRASLFAQEAIRVVCINGMVRPYYESHAVKMDHDALNAQGVQAAVQALLAGGKDFGQDMTDFVNKAMAKELTPTPSPPICTPVVESAGDHVSRTLVKRAAGNVGNVLPSPSDDFRNAGITTLKTAWDYVNLFTFLAQMFPKEESRIRAQGQAVDWGRFVMN